MDDTTKQKYIQSLLYNNYSCLLQNFLHDVENDEVDIETDNQFSGIINLLAQKSAKFKIYSSHKRKEK